MRILTYRISYHTRGKNGIHTADCAVHVSRVARLPHITPIMCARIPLKSPQLHRIGLLFRLCVSAHIFCRDFGFLLRMCMYPSMCDVYVCIPAIPPLVMYHLISGTRIRVIRIILI